MQIIQPQRSKFKKCTKYYVQDNILDIIDIEETLLKNRYITKVQKQDFIYAKFLPKYESLKSLPQPKPIILKSLSKEKLIQTKELKPINNPNNKGDDNKNNQNQNKNKNEDKTSLYNSENINFDVLNVEQKQI